MTVVVLSLTDVLGWVGGLVATAGYVLAARGRVRPDSPRFHALNMAAAAMLAVAAFSRDALPSACLNVAWIIFGALSVTTAVARPVRREPSARTPAPEEALAPRLPAELTPSR
jgi:hypothetical protein